MGFGGKYGNGEGWIGDPGLSTQCRAPEESDNRRDNRRGGVVIFKSI